MLADAWLEFYIIFNFNENNFMPGIKKRNNMKVNKIN